MFLIMQTLSFVCVAALIKTLTSTYDITAVIKSGFFDDMQSSNNSLKIRIFSVPLFLKPVVLNSFSTPTCWKNQMCDILRPKYILIWFTMFLGPKNGTAVDNRN